MTAAPAIKGWCPTLLAPMQSGDGWLARVKPSACVVTTAAARVIAHAATHHGNGHIDLTSRGNLQVRGLSPRSAELFAETILATGLASADPAVEAIRNVMASPLGPDDPTAGFDSHAFAREIEAMLLAEDGLQALPAKFCVLVDGGGALPLAGITADIMVRAHGDALGVELDGGMLAARGTLAETVKALALGFLRLSRERREPPRRMAALAAEIGAAAIFDAAGLEPIEIRHGSSAASRASIGFVPLPAPAEGCFGVGLPFGRIEAAGLISLAELSERYGDGSLRTTPWRALLLPGIASEAVAHITHDVEALSLIADAADPRLSTFACVGAPDCRSASVDARGDAARLAAAIPAAGVRSLHVSGCAKSCAHRGDAALTLVGRDGRYELIRDGGANEKPALAGLTIAEVIVLLQSAEGEP
jgi:precorrin-3B synthase